MGVKVGSGVDVAVAVFVAGITVGWDVEVTSICSTGADVDAAGLAQADRHMINVNNRGVIRFMVPLFVGKTKRGGKTLPQHLICHCERSLQDNPQLNEEIASLLLAMTWAMFFLIQAMTQKPSLRRHIHS